MAALDDVSFATDRGGVFPESNDWADSGCGADGIVFHGVPTNATSVQLSITYAIDNNHFGDVSGCCTAVTGEHGWADGNCCGSWGALDYWTVPAGHATAYRWDSATPSAPYGWGTRIMSGTAGDTWGTEWWDTGEHINMDDDNDDGVIDAQPEDIDYGDADPDTNDQEWNATTGLDTGVDIYPLEGSGDPNLPYWNDLHGGGDMFTHIGFTGFPTTLTTYQWGTTDVANGVDWDGDVWVVFCGGSFNILNIDQAVLTYTMGTP
jgi:hypothetical protein